MAISKVSSSTINNGIYKSFSANPISAVGGAIYSRDKYIYHVFTSSGTFTPSYKIDGEVLVIGGGGGSGGGGSSSNHGRSGGGGAGGVVYAKILFGKGITYTCTVGNGGTAGSKPSGSGNGLYYGSNGQNSFISGSDIQSVIAYGGGGGGAGNASGFSFTNDGVGGASGGGAATFNGAGGYGSSQGLQGNNGGAAVEAPPQYGSGGGGGAGGNGGSGTSAAAGAGGVGTSEYSEWGLATGFGQNVNGVYYFAGGGGGAAYTDNNLAGLGGLGGGGRGATGQGTAGTANTGGGGGGSTDGNPGASGGSGIIIVRYMA